MPENSQQSTERAAKAEQALQLIEGWIAKQKPSCPESIWQVDHFCIASMELSEELCGLVGYYVDKE